MKVLLLGSGGREHAIAWKLNQSKNLQHLYIAPGNAGTSQIGENVNLNISKFEEIKDFVLSNKIEMLVVGPEQPLVDGITDYFKNDSELNSIMVIGPTKAGAILEGSKDFAKEFMYKYSIPTAAYKSFNKKNLSDGYKFLEGLNAPYVLKADGLAAGKGVLILNKIDEAKKALKEMLGGQFGDASNTVVIEEFLDGIELSVFVLTDGKDYKILPNAKDYKRIGEGDTGLNTGGMGAISPVPFADDDFLKNVEDKVIIPTIEGLKKEEIDYKGFIFFGLIKVNGEPFVIEYNVRMGDPETEVVIPRIKSDLLELFSLAGKGRLSEYNLETDERACTTVMLVSGGYPEAYEKDKVITGLENVDNSVLFHAGTKMDEKGNIKTSGGRVIAISSYAESFEDALKISYNNAEKVKFDKKYYRQDLGFDLK